MSYLLEALKKAELERKAQSGGGVTSLPTAKVSANLPAWLVVVVSMFLIITLIKLFMPNTALTEVDTEPRVVTGLMPMPAVPPDHLVNEPSQGAISPTKIEAGNIKVYELAELPKEILNLIPTLSLQSHIFSSAPEYRSVVINEQTFNEGMFINVQVVLQEITHTGIVINVAGRNVALAKGVSWVSSKHVK